MGRQFILISGHLLNVCVFLFLTFLIYINGSRILRRINIKTHSRTEEIVFSFVLGFLAAQFITLFLGLSGLLYPSIFRTLAIGLLILQYKAVIGVIKDFVHYLRQLWNNLIEGWFQADFLFQGILFFILLRFILVYLLGALSPEIEGDALTYHLGALRLYIHHHKIFNVANIFYSNFPFGMEMLFLLGWLIKDVVVGKLFSFLASILLLLSIFAFCKRYLTSQIALLAAVIFYTSPAVGLAAKSAYIDLALGYSTFLAFYALWNYKNSGELKWIYLCGLFAGLSLTIKYTGINSLLLAIASIVAIEVFSSKGVFRERIKNGLKYGFVIGLIALIVFSPWALKNWKFTRNPVFPFLTSFFPSEYMSIEFLNAWTEVVFDRYVRNFHFYLTLLWQIAYRAENLKGWPLGPFFLIAPFFLFVKRKSITIWYLFLLSTFGFTLWLLHSTQPRFLLQYWTLISILISYLVFMLYNSRLLRVPAKIGVLILLFALWNRAENWTPDVIYGKESEDEYLAKAFPGYSYINQHLPDDAQILALNYPNQSLTTRTIWQPDTSFGGNQLGNDLFFAVFQEQRLACMQVDVSPAIKAKHIRFMKMRLDPDPWWIFEVGVYCKDPQSGTQRFLLPVQARTKFRPYRTSRAYDLNLGTLWDSGPEKPGMFFDLELIDACLVDQITYVSKEWESPETIQVGVSLDGNSWRPAKFNGKATSFNVSPTIIKGALYSVQSAGINYLYWQGGPEQGYYKISQALEQNKELFGLKLLFKQKDITLYEIQPQTKENVVCFPES